MTIIQFLVPAVTFYTTYYENLGGIANIVGGNQTLMLGAQAALGAFGGMVVLGFINRSSFNSNSLKHAAMVGGYAAAAAVVAQVAQGVLGLYNPFIPAGAAAIAVYYANVTKMIPLDGM